MQITSTLVTKNDGSTWSGTWSTVLPNAIHCNATEATWPPAGFLAAGNTYVVSGTRVDTGVHFTSASLRYDAPNSESPTIVAFS